MVTYFKNERKKQLKFLWINNNNNCSGTFHSLLQNANTYTVRVSYLLYLYGITKLLDHIIGNGLKIYRNDNKSSLNIRHAWCGCHTILMLDPLTVKNGEKKKNSNLFRLRNSRVTILCKDLILAVTICALIFRDGNWTWLSLFFDEMELGPFESIIQTIIKMEIGIESSKRTEYRFHWFRERRLVH